MRITENRVKCFYNSLRSGSLHMLGIFQNRGLGIYRFSLLLRRSHICNSSLVLTIRWWVCYHASWYDPLRRVDVRGQSNPDCWVFRIPWLPFLRTAIQPHEETTSTFQHHPDQTTLNQKTPPHSESPFSYQSFLFSPGFWYPELAHHEYTRFSLRLRLILGGSQRLHRYIFRRWSFRIFDCIPRRSHIAWLRIWFRGCLLVRLFWMDITASGATNTK